MKLTPNDRRYWLDMEKRIKHNLVDLSTFGFIVDHWCFHNGWTKDKHCLARPGIVEALDRARDNLPRGYNFKIFDGWRSRNIQKKASQETRSNLIKLHPDWSRQRITNALRSLCPFPASVLMDMGTHRFGGSLDLTVIDASGQELEMTTKKNDAGEDTSTPDDSDQNYLLYFDNLSKPTKEELEIRQNRHIMIGALEKVSFTSLMVEWWHWDYREDLEL